MVFDEAIQYWWLGYEKKITGEGDSLVSYHQGYTNMVKTSWAELCIVYGRDHHRQKWQTGK